MEEWANDFDSWDVCGSLFDKTPYAYQKATQWCQQEKEFVRRAGFVMMAELAIHDKQAQDEVFLQFFPLIKPYAGDERNCVKKAVNWALRQIGKRNTHLRTVALACAYEIQDMDSKTAHWVAKDALKEFQAKKIKNELTSPFRERGRRDCSCALLHRHPSQVHPDYNRKVAELPFSE